MEKSNLNIGKISKFFKFRGGGISEKSNLIIGKNSKFFKFRGGGILEKSNLNIGKNSKGGYFGIFSICQNKRFWRI